MATLCSSARLAIVNGEGTVGYTVYDSDFAIVGTRVTAGVVEVQAGTGMSIYGAKITIDDALTEGIVVWDDAAGNIVGVPFRLTSSGGGGSREITIEIS